MATTESRWSAWMRNGRASFLAWVVALSAYITCGKLGIASEEVKYTLYAATGVFLGNLGIAQGQRNARVEERGVQTRRRVDQLEEDVQTGKTRADRSEARESEWSKHRDHSPPEVNDD